MNKLYKSLDKLATMLGMSMPIPSEVRHSERYQNKVIEKAIEELDKAWNTRPTDDKVARIRAEIEEMSAYETWDRYTVYKRIDKEAVLEIIDKEGAE